jgi:hypothetical protein
VQNTVQCVRFVNFRPVCLWPCAAVGAPLSAKDCHLRNLRDPGMQAFAAAVPILKLSASTLK